VPINSLQRLIVRASLVTRLFVQLFASVFSAGSEDNFFASKTQDLQPTLKDYHALGSSGSHIQVCEPVVKETFCKRFKKQS